MRAKVLVTIAMAVLAAVLAVGIAAAAGAEGPVTVKVGEMELTADGGFAPRALPRSRQTPISVWASGSVRMRDGSHPPAIREVLIEADKNGEAHAAGIPTCASGRLQATTTAEALQACSATLIAEGHAVAEVAFAEQKPIEVTSKLLVFNGGEKDGAITWFGHVYFTDPIRGALVGTITITKIHRGRFGTLGVVRIPQIAGGAGSGISFDLRFARTVKAGGRALPLITASCPDGKLRVHVEGRFEDGTKASTETVRRCTPTS